MRGGIQNQLTALGESSCYFLCLCKIAEEANTQPIDIVNSFDLCVGEKYIRFNYNKPDDGDNCYIDNPSGILELLTRKTWSYRRITTQWEIECWKAGEKEYTIQRWYRKTTGKEYTHFRRPVWDPLLDSQTVKYGAIDVLYIFTMGEDV